jgi:flagellar biosynthesis/type III secretory pathway M-ring protein FliF/YscJ
MKINREVLNMSANQSNPGNPPFQKPLPAPGKNDPKIQHPPARQQSGAPDLNAQDEYIKQLLEKMVQENPAGVAEIIHLWLAQDKTRNE